MKILQFFSSLAESYRTDPLIHCKVYKQVGCSHVDGPLCDLKTCTVEVTLSLTPNKITEVIK